MRYSGPILIILIAFGLSGLLRSPQLNRPISKHHEFCLAVSMQVLNNWELRGFSDSRGLPCMTYPGSVNAHINNFSSASGRMVDESGRYYYVSHPPFAYYLTWFTLSPFEGPITPLQVQILNLILHLISTLLVFFIAVNLNSSFGRTGSEFGPLIAALFYLFAPVTLWFQGNVYMSDMAVQTFFAASLLIYTSSRERKTVNILTPLFFLLAFLMAYTTWFGYLAAAVLLLFLILDIGQRRLALFDALAVLTGVITASILTYSQYKQIAGHEALMEEWFNRAGQRSGLGELLSFSSEGIMSFMRMGKAIAMNYLSSFLPLFLLLILFFDKIVKNRKIPLPPDLQRFLLISILPIALLHLLLAEYSGHDFTTLYAAIPFAILCGLWMQIFWKKKPLVRIAIVTTSILLMAAIYTFVNRPGDISMRNDRYAMYQEIGETIGTNTGDDKVAFIMGVRAYPEIVYYAGRNILTVKSIEEAEEHLETWNQEKGKLYIVKPGDALGMEERILSIRD